MEYSVAYCLKLFPPWCILYFQIAYLITEMESLIQTCMDFLSCYYQKLIYIIISE